MESTDSMTSTLSALVTKVRNKWGAPSEAQTMVWTFHVGDFDQPGGVNITTTRAVSEPSGAVDQFAGIVGNFATPDDDVVVYAVEQPDGVLFVAALARDYSFLVAVFDLDDDDAKASDSTDDVFNSGAIVNNLRRFMGMDVPVALHGPRVVELRQVVGEYLADRPVRPWGDGDPAESKAFALFLAWACSGIDPSRLADVDDETEQVLKDGFSRFTDALDGPELDWAEVHASHRASYGPESDEFAWFSWMDTQGVAAEFLDTFNADDTQELASTIASCVPPDFDSVAGELLAQLGLAGDP